MKFVVVDFDKSGYVIERLVYIIMDVIYGASLLACPLLLHLMGRLLLDLFVVGVSADSEFFSCGSLCHFLGVYLFLLFFRDCFPGGWL